MHLYTVVGGDLPFGVAVVVVAVVVMVWGCYNNTVFSVWQSIYIIYTLHLYIFIGTHCHEKANKNLTRNLYIVVLTRSIGALQQFRPLRLPRAFRLSHLALLRRPGLCRPLQWRPLADPCRPP